MNSMYEELKKQCKGNIKENELLASYTTYKVGGLADLFFTATTADELVQAVTASRTLGIPFFILGGGSNIIFSDEGFRGLVIKNNTNGISIRGMKGNIKGNASQGLVYLEADSGVPMNRLVRFAIEEGLGGLEMHLGLPGSVGGAVFMNSKWTKPMGFVGDCLYQATVLTSDNVVKTVDNNYFDFSYGRSSLQKNGDILLRAIFCLQQEEKDALWSRANESILYRKETQPQGVHTAGCVFKNISSADAMTFGTPDHATSAGFLLDQAGCKGMSVRGAEVSPIHANFIVTRAGATASDVIELIHLMKKSVKEKFGVHLKEEIIRVGEF